MKPVAPPQPPPALQVEVSAPGSTGARLCRGPLIPSTDKQNLPFRSLPSQEEALRRENSPGGPRRRAVGDAARVTALAL